MRQEQIVCDGCQDDLTETGNSVDWRLALYPERIPVPQRFSSVTDVMIKPDISQVHHFCGLQCLERWLKIRGARA
jgi:hypothetical protein